MKLVLPVICMGARLGLWYLERP